MAKRKPTYHAHQSSLSVQDIKDYSTPEGASMANEEMRRLKLGIEQLQKGIEEVAPTPIAEQPASTPDTQIIKGGEWATTSKHNNDLVAPSKTVQVIDFDDTSTIEFEIENFDTKEFATIDDAQRTRIRARIPDGVIPEPEDAMLDFNSLWEYKENNNYEVTAGAIETMNGLTINPTNTPYEICNRNAQHLMAGYPRTNDGQGWIPIGTMGPISEVIADGRGAVRSLPLQYAHSPTPFLRETLFFVPPKNGVYKFDLNVYIKGVFSSDSMVSFRPYDSFDRMMLIAEKCTYDQIIKNNWLEHNPLQYSEDGLIWQANTNQKYIIDMRSNFGDVDYTRNNTAIAGYGNTAGVYGSGENGCSLGGPMSPDMNVGGSIEIYLTPSDVMMFWYKPYGHRIVGSGSYYTISLEQTGGPLIGAPWDYIFYPDQRYERFAVQYIGEGDTSDETNRQNVTSIIERF